MRTLVYAMDKAPWQLIVEVQAAGLLRANLLYYADNGSTSVSLRPDTVGLGRTTWSFSGAPKFKTSDLEQRDVDIVLNADGGAGKAELLYLELQHWEDPFNNSGKAHVSIDVIQGGSKDVTEVTIAASGAPQTNKTNGPYVFTTPVAWREAGLYFDWR